MQADSDTCVFLFVLIVVWKDNLRAWKIINFTLRAVRSHVGGVHSLVSYHEVRNIVKLRQVWHFLVVHELFDSPIDCSLPRAHSIMPEFNKIFALLCLSQIEHNDTFASP